MQMPDHAAPETLTWALEVVTGSHLVAADAAVRFLGLSARDHQILAIVARWKPANQADLAEHLGVDRTSMTHLLDTLETQGFITRAPDPADRRAKKIHLTPPGRAVLDRADRAVREAEDRLLELLDDGTSLRTRLIAAATALLEHPRRPLRMSWRRL